MDSSSAQGRPSTRQRSVIESLLREQADFGTAQQLHLLLRGQGQRVGLATVYRWLHQMVETGEVDTVRTSDGESAYRRCSPGQHHHLICGICGKTVELRAASVARWIQRVAADQGFVEVHDSVDILGTCAACAG